MLSVTGVAVTVATPLPEPNTKKVEEGFSLLMVGGVRAGLFLISAAPWVL